MKCLKWNGNETQHVDVCRTLLKQYLEKKMILNASIRAHIDLQQMS